MSLISRAVETGILRTTIYDFPETGDELPMHAHPAGQCHITIISRGRFKVFGHWGENGELVEIEKGAGAYLVWKPEQTHGLIALEPNSRIHNIVYDAPLALPGEAFIPSAPTG